MAVPLLIEFFAPRSVVDVGCGTGLWAASFLERGVSDVMAIDGAWVPETERDVPAAVFREHDLTQPLQLDKTFDLALCLEAAEHLPLSAALRLVESLTRLAPVVVFSAAIPFQGGDGHINEQWPSFWSKQFATYGYTCLTGLRHRLWTNDAVEVWYRQNMLCFVAPSQLDRCVAALGAGGDGDATLLDVVHPDLYARMARNLTQQTARAERLERALRQSRSELFQFKNSKVFRFYQAVYPAWVAARRIASRFHNSSTDRSANGRVD